MSINSTSGTLSWTRLQYKQPISNAPHSVFKHVECAWFVVQTPPRQPRPWPLWGSSQDTLCSSAEYTHTHTPHRTPPPADTLPTAGLSTSGSSPDRAEEEGSRVSWSIQRDGIVFYCDYSVCKGGAQEWKVLFLSFTPVSSTRAAVLNTWCSRQQVMQLQCSLPRCLPNKCFSEGFPAVSPTSASVRVSLLSPQQVLQWGFPCCLFNKCYSTAFPPTSSTSAIARLSLIPPQQVLQHGFPSYLLNKCYSTAFPPTSSTSAIARLSLLPPQQVLQHGFPSYLLNKRFSEAFPAVSSKNATVRLSLLSPQQKLQCDWWWGWVNELTSSKSYWNMENNNNSNNSCMLAPCQPYMAVSRQIIIIIITGRLIDDRYRANERLSGFEYAPKWCTYSAVWSLYGWCHVKLLPSSLGASSVYTIQPCTMPRHFMQSHIHRVHECLAVTCHLHFGRMTGIFYVGT